MWRVCLCGVCMYFFALKRVIDQCGKYVCLAREVNSHLLLVAPTSRTNKGKIGHVCADINHLPAFLRLAPTHKSFFARESSLRYSILSTLGGRDGRMRPITVSSYL